MDIPKTRFIAFRGNERIRADSLTMAILLRHKGWFVYDSHQAYWLDAPNDQTGLLPSKLDPSQVPEKFRVQALLLI